MHHTVLFLAGGGLLLLLLEMFLLWLVHLPVRNAAWVDVGWASGLGLIAVFYACFGREPLPRMLLLILTAGTWASRLAWHLYRDRVAGGVPEEGRYQTLRASWGGKAPFYFLFFFLGQGLLNIILSLPFLLIVLDSRSFLTPWEWAGLVLWLFAVGGEALSDAQLKSFKANSKNKGQVCNAGLWKYSRHPNYFCEWLIWCSYALMAMGGLSGGLPGLAGLGWLGWISPIIILTLLFKVSGIPPTEKQALKSRGDAYRRYQATTSAFFPWFPKIQKSEIKP